MHIIFDPPLRTTTTILLPPSSSIPTFRNDYLPSSNSVSLALYVSLSKDNLAELNRQGAKIEVWSDLPHPDRPKGEWGPTGFQAEENSATSNGHTVDNELRETFILSLAVIPQEKETPLENSYVTLKACFHLQLDEITSSSGNAIFQYTYRILYPDGGIWWQGVGESSNGNIDFQYSGSPVSHNGSWDVLEDGSECFADISSGSKSIVASLNDVLQWGGWSIGEDGPVSFDIPSKPPPLCKFIFLIPSLPEQKYASFNYELDPFILHTTANSFISISPDGKIIFEAGSHNKEHPDDRLLLRNLSVDVIAPLFNLMASSLDKNDHFNIKKTAWTIIPQDSSCYTAFISPARSPARTVQVVPLRSHTTNSSSQSVLGFESSVLLDAIGGKGVIFNIDTCDGTPLDPNESILRVRVSPSGGSFILSPSLEVPIPSEEDGEEKTLISPLSPFKILSASLPPPSLSLSKNESDEFSHDMSIDDPGLVDPVPLTEEKQSSISSVQRKPSNSMIAPAAYLAILISIIMAYIGPSTSMRYGSWLSEPKIPKDSEQNGTKTRSEPALSDDDRDDKHSMRGTSAEVSADNNKIIFHIDVQSSQPLRFLVQSTKSNVPKLLFKIGEKEEMPELNELRPGLWLTEMENQSEDTLQVSLGSENYIE